MAGLRDTAKGIVGGTVVSRSRDDLRPGLQMATSGRHCIFFDADQSRVLVVRVLHDRMDYRRHLETNEGMVFGRELVMRGSEERLTPILMTALATGLALVPPDEPVLPVTRVAPGDPSPVYGSGMAGGTMSEGISITLNNAKAEAVKVRVSENLGRWTDWQVVDSNVPATKRNAQTASFDLPVPAGGKATLTYTVRYRWAADVKIP